MCIGKGRTEVSCFSLKKSQVYKWGYEGGWFVNFSRKAFISDFFTLVFWNDNSAKSHSVIVCCHINRSVKILKIANLAACAVVVLLVLLASSSNSSQSVAAIAIRRRAFPCSSLSVGDSNHRHFARRVGPFKEKDIAMMSGGVSVMDGKKIAAEIRAELTSAIAASSNVPGLAVILVGNRTDSRTYVTMKKRACEECGMSSFGCEYPDSVAPAELLAKIREYNDDPRVHGILIQLPLPPHLDEATILAAIRHEKDVDGLHPINSAALLCGSLPWTDMTRVPFHIPCTPQGCIELLDRSHIDIAGKHAVVVGRSKLVGLPVAMLLLHRNATVTIVHSQTVDSQTIISQADILIVAVGKARFIQGDWISRGTVVIDVGINTVNDPTTKRGYRLVGDVDTQGVMDKGIAGAITPVPGGVGPMTIAMLLRNTWNSCQHSQRVPSDDNGK